MNDTMQASFELLRGLQPLAELDASSLSNLIPLVERQLIHGLEPLDIQDWHRQLVYLVKGELKLEFADTSTLVLVGGSEETLRPIGKWGPSPVSAKAITDIELLCLDEDKLDIMLILRQLTQQRAAQKQVRRIEDPNAEGVEWRKIEGKYAGQGLKSGVFTALPTSEIEELLRRFQRIKVRRGEALVRQDEEGDYYYVIETGRCQVTRQVSGSPLALAELKAGDAFGEEALVTDASRNATVTMKSDGVLLRIGKKDFIELLRTRLLQTISYAEAQRHVANGAVWIDVRFAAEFQYDGIAGARNIPLNSIREACEHLDPQKEYIVYCQNGRRSSVAAFLLAQRGFRASLLEGGLCCGEGDNKGKGV